MTSAWLRGGLRNNIALRKVLTSISERSDMRESSFFRMRGALGSSIGAGNGRL